MVFNVSCNGSSKTFQLTNVAPAKPYLNVSNSYLPLVSTNSAKAGVKLYVQSSNSTYRAKEYEKVTGSKSYYSSAAAVGNLSSTTALTRPSTSTTGYLTAPSTTRTEPLTRPSTSTTGYLTAPSTTRTEPLTRPSTSKSSTDYHVTSTSFGGGVSRNMTFQYIKLSYSSWTKVDKSWITAYQSTYMLNPGWPNNYKSSDLMRGYFSAPSVGKANLGYSYFVGYRNNNSWYITSQAQSVTSPSPTPELVNNLKATSNQPINIPLNQTVGGFGSTLQNKQINVVARMGSSSIISTFESYYGTGTKRRTSFYSTVYLTAFALEPTLLFDSIASYYSTCPSTSGTSYYTAPKTTSTTYGTRPSTSGTSYYTAPQTTKTTYGTRPSTSGYSGVSSSSSSVMSWI